jgi:hypothetical protein
MQKTPEITRLIHDNFWIIASYTFGQPVVIQMMEKQFHGEWKFWENRLSMPRYVPTGHFSNWLPSYSIALMGLVGGLAF